MSMPLEAGLEDIVQCIHTEDLNLKMNRLIWNEISQRKGKHLTEKAEVPSL